MKIRVYKFIIISDKRLKYFGTTVCLCLFVIKKSRIKESMKRKRCIYQYFDLKKKRE